MKKICLLLAALALTGQAAVASDGIHKRLYSLDIPAHKFTEIKLSATQGVQLPLKNYPKINDYRAFRLIPAAGEPVEIVIKTEPSKDEFINEIDQHASREKNSMRKQIMARMSSAARRHKDKGEGVHMIYRAVKKPSGTFYKLINLRVPGTKDNDITDDEAIIVATPNAHLQLFEDSDIPGQKQVIELDAATDATPN
jgi:hypothetical protein